MQERSCIHSHQQRNVCMPPSQLQMRRPNLDHLPEAPPLPDGYELREFGPDDSEQDLCDTLQSAFPETAWSVERVREQLTASPAVLATYVVIHDGVPVAVTASRYVPEMYPGTGYVHWVGTHADHTRKGLGMALMVRVLQDFVDRDYRDAILETDDFRLPAIRSYLRCGFVPVLTFPDGDHSERWSEVFPRLFERSPATGSR